MSHVAPGLVDTPQTYSGTLNGKIVFTSGGHGWKGSGTSYTTDRPEYWRQTDGGGAVIDDGDIVEDFGNQDQLTFYADYLLRAGATVVPMRPIGRQTSQVVLDNDSAGVTFSGTWSNSGSTRFYDEDYGAALDAVPYRFASTTTGAETATATYTPNIPAAGMYPVYAWVLRGTDRTSQLYEINHTGGQTQVRVDHSKVGSGWVYLGTYHFNSGSSASLGSVQISNQAAVTGKVVIADAIRFGNGMGDYIEPGATVISGKPREDENSEHWIARMLGQGTTLSEVGLTDNVNGPSNMAEWMFSGTYNPAGGVVDAVYIGFHSNGTTGDPDTATGRGARGLIEIDVSEQTPHQTGTNGLAPILGNQINQDFQNLNGVFEVNWTSSSSATASNDFGEINLGADAEMDATIIEVAFHDNVQDNMLLRDPKARDQIARSVYQGTLQYFAAWGGATNTSLPTPPTNVRAVSNASGQVTINWSAGPSTPSSVYGAEAAGYKVYASVDGYGFDGGTAVAGGGTTSVTLSGFAANTPYYFRVAATNAGGESRSSEVVTALPSGGAKQVLIVNGFDRYDRSQNFRYTYAGGDSEGLADRVWSRYNNSFDYVVQFHTAIHASKPGTHVDGTSNEAVISGAVNLADYDAVMWILGNESTVNDTFNATEQTKVSQFIAAGGHLFVSGSEIGWDLDQQNNGRTFFENTLKGNYVSDDANTYTATAAAGGIFAGMSNVVFSSGSPSTGANAYSTRDTQLYNVTTPDVIAPQPGAVVALNYNNGAGAAAIQVEGTGGAGNIVMFGFPFETITDATRRQNAMDRILDFFTSPAPMPAVEIKSRVNGEDADSPTGPVLAEGDLAIFSYILTNTGNVSLSNIAVLDDNGTPGSAADDFNPAFPSGDANGNGLLDVGENWTYLAARYAAAGQVTATATVTTLGAALAVADSDPANYFGAAPAISVQSAINGDDANSPPGPTLTVGSTATFSYQVTNAGNTPLGMISLVDDNGTPGNTVDNFNPAYVSGDANGNNQLDVGETWVFAADRPVAEGQQAHAATAVGLDVINQLVFNADATHYVGVLPPTADFDGSGQIDGFDFLAWQIGFGTTSGATLADGDGTRDHVVDEADLALWIAGLPEATVSAASAMVVSNQSAPQLATVLPTFSLDAFSNPPGQGARSGLAVTQLLPQVAPNFDSRQLRRPSPRLDFQLGPDSQLAHRSVREQQASQFSMPDWAECVDQALKLPAETVAKRSVH